GKRWGMEAGVARDAHRPGVGQVVVVAQAARRFIAIGADVVVAHARLKMVAPETTGVDGAHGVGVAPGGFHAGAVLGPLLDTLLVGRYPMVVGQLYVVLPTV